MFWFYDSLDTLGITDEDFMDYVEQDEEWPPVDIDDIFQLPPPDELGIYAELPF